MAEPILRNGSSGEAVRELQLALQETGHNPGPIDAPPGFRCGVHKVVNSNRCRI